MFIKLKKPPKWMLEGLLNEEKERPCPDCAAPPGHEHDDNCDVARCLKGGFRQRLTCDCGDCGRDIWTGLWPGTAECFRRGLVAMDTLTSRVGFDFNSLQEELAKERDERET